MNINLMPFHVTSAFSFRATSPAAEGTTISHAEPTDGIWSEDQWRQLAAKGDAEVEAGRKIEDAKKELEFLQRGGFPPEVIARLARELAGRLQSAAGDFAQSVGMAGGSDAAAISQFEAAGSVDAAAPSKLSTPDLDDAQTEPEFSEPTQTQEENLASRAYTAVMEDAKGGPSTAAEDSKIMSQFQALIEEAKRLAEKHDRQVA